MLYSATVNDQRGATAALAVGVSLWGLIAGPLACRRGQSASSSSGAPSVRWSIDVGAVATPSSLAVAPDGTAYVAGYSPAETPPPGFASAEGFWQGHLYAVDAEGRVVRSLAGAVSRRKAEVWVQLAPWGAAFAVGAEGGIYGLLPAGRQEFGDAHTVVFGPPAIGARGELYVGGDGLTILQLGSEKPARHFASAYTSGSPPAVGEDYLAIGQTLFAFGTGGNPLWEFEATTPLATPAAPAPDGSVYVATDSGLLYAVEGGRKRWSLALEHRIASYLSVDPDGVVFAGDAMGRVYAVDPDGRRRWAMPLEAGPCTPVPGPDGTVYAACANGRLYALAAHPGGR